MTHILRPASYKSFARISALVGALVYIFLPPLAALFLSEGSESYLIKGILLLGVLLIVPLGLFLIPITKEDDSLLYRLAVILQPCGALMVLLSFAIDKGTVAAVLTSGWLISTGVIALAGVFRLLRKECRTSAEIAVNAGMLYLPVGAVWLIMSRLGIQPLGFGDTIVLLTAVHFHFAGFAAPLLAGLAGRHLQTMPGVHTWFVLIVACVIAGTPLVAAGITVSPVVALVGASIISLGLITLAILVIGLIVPTISTRLPQVLLVFSSLATLPAMVLACAYAYSIVFHKLIIDIPQMAKTHGIANAFGFALCGLTAWSLIDRSNEKSAHQT